MNFSALIRAQNPKNAQKPILHKTKSHLNVHALCEVLDVLRGILYTRIKRNKRNHGLQAFLCQEKRGQSIETAQKICSNIRPSFIGRRQTGLRRPRPLRLGRVVTGCLTIKSVPFGVAHHNSSEKQRRKNPERFRVRDFW